MLVMKATGSPVFAGTLSQRADAMFRRSIRALLHTCRRGIRRSGGGSSAAAVGCYVRALVIQGAGHWHQGRILYLDTRGKDHALDGGFCRHRG